MVFERAYYWIAQRWSGRSSQVFGAVVRGSITDSGTLNAFLLYIFPV